MAVRKAESIGPEDLGSNPVTVQSLSISNWNYFLYSVYPTPSNEDIGLDGL